MKSLSVSSRIFGLVCFFLIAPLLCWSQDGAATEPIKTTEPAVSQLKLDLHQAQALMPSVSDLNTRARLNVLLMDAQAQATGLHENPVPSRAAVKPAPVSEHQLIQLSKGLKAETFDEGKISYIQQISRTHFFTAAQARLLLTTFTFDEGREDAAAALYPHIVDQDNFPAILDVFTFDDGRAETCKRLNL